MRFHLIVPDTRKDRRDSFSWLLEREIWLLFIEVLLLVLTNEHTNLETTQKIFFKNLVFWRLIVILYGLLSFKVFGNLK